MESIGLRLKKYFEYKGVVRKEFAEDIDIPYASLTHILNSNRNMSSEIMEKIFNNLPELNARWLITGKGPMEYTAASYFLDPDKEENSIAAEPAKEYMKKIDTEALLEKFISSEDVRSAMMKLIIDTVEEQTKKQKL